MDCRAQMARDFGSNRRLEAQEYFVYFKPTNGRVGAKDPPSAEDSRFRGSSSKSQGGITPPLAGSVNQQAIIRS